MKYTPEAYLDSFIKIMTANCLKAEYPYVYAYKFGKFENELKLYQTPEQYSQRMKAGEPVVTKNFRTLRIYADSIETNFRNVVYENHFVAKNPASFLKDNWKDNLVSDFISYAIQTLLMENTNKYAQAPEYKEPEPQPETIKDEA